QGQAGRISDPADGVSAPQALSCTETAYRESRCDEARKYQIYAHELYRGRDGNREQDVEGDAAEPRDSAEPQPEHERVSQRRVEERLGCDPENLTYQQLAQMLAAVRVAGEQQDTAAR